MLLPESTSGWRGEPATTFQGKRFAVLRKSGVSMTIRGTRGHGWHVVRMQGGKVLADGAIRTLPPDWEAIMYNGERRGARPAARTPRRPRVPADSFLDEVVVTPKALDAMARLRGALG